MLAERQPGKAVLLLVEDDATTADALTLFLEVDGYTVATSRNGQEALVYLRGNPLPDLILLDLMLPGTDGWDFRRQQQLDPILAPIPVIVFSAVAEDAERADALGNVGYLQKPVDADLLLSAIRRFGVPKKPGILVVEDEVGILRMLDLALRQYGFDVKLAASGQEAIALYQRHQPVIDLVLMDVQMPRLDGPQTLAALQKINPAVRCCFISAHTGKYDAEELRAMGAAHVISKPFISLSVLARTIWDIVTMNQ